MFSEAEVLFLLQDSEGLHRARTNLSLCAGQIVLGRRGNFATDATTDYAASQRLRNLTDGELLAPVSASNVGKFTHNGIGIIRAKVAGDVSPG